MSSPDAYTHPTMALLHSQSPQRQSHQYVRQGAHVIRRNDMQPVTCAALPPEEALEEERMIYFGEKMPESVRKSYMQQKLPVRKQSLAYHRHSCAISRRNTRQTSPLAQLPSPLGGERGMHQASEAISSSLSPIAKLQAPPTRTSSMLHRKAVKQAKINSSRTEADDAAATPQAPIHSPAVIDERDDEDFDFKDRPPSTVICIRPIDTHSEDGEDMSPFSPSSSGEAYVFPTDNAASQASVVSATTEEFNINTMAAGLPPPGELDRRPSETVSVETAAIDHEEPRMICTRSDSTVSLNTPRESRDTDSLPSPSSEHSRPGSSRLSIFLKMQQKREERRKSIFAYRASKPTVYPAILSLVARELYRRLSTRSITRNNIEYHNVFEGKEAVDRLVSILKTNDRNLALLVGRALDAQNFLHDVNYEHRLRDSTDELYCFRNEIGIPLGIPPSLSSNEDDKEEECHNANSELPTGVFTVLTDCYSPTCSRNKPCYSVHCPRKTFKNLKRSPSASSLQDNEEECSLWMHSVPKELLDATPPEERKRQECIYELIHTEQNFVRDLQYIHNFWVKPLITKEIIPDERREHFVQEVFWNIADIEKINAQLSRTLNERQKDEQLVSTIGDILVEFVGDFDPFVAYGAHQVIGKSTFELEKKRNPRFAEFVEETERRPESRRLELNGYLTKPTTRLGRYNLLLREILKHTPEDNPDYTTIPKIMDLITGLLTQVNAEAGKYENIFNLQQIEERLSFKTSGDYVDLKLREPGRQLVMKGRMSRKGNSSSDSSDLQLFLFDHYLVFAKIKYHDHLEYYKVHRKPVPLELLSVSVAGPTPNNRVKRASTILQYSRSTTLLPSSNVVSPRPSSSETPVSNKSISTAITFYHHGRRGSPPLTLYTSSASTQKAWIEQIKAQQRVLSEQRSIFTLKPLVQRDFALNNKIHSSAIVHDDTNNDQILIIGADHGVYISQYPNNDVTERTTKRIMTYGNVTQVDLVENSQILVLAEKTLWSFPLEMALAGELQYKRTRPISQHAAFFRVGECMGKTLVCIVKTGTLMPTTIRVLEPVAIEDDKKSKRTLLKRLVRNNAENLRPYKDLYLPSEASEINLLKTKMCVSCPQEIGVIDMKTFEVQALLDPDDEELAFVFNRQDLRPISIYRIQFAEYLVCYNEFAFIVDQRGRLKKSACRFDWEGIPDSFALLYPYVLAFEPDFIEVRNILTGTVDQLIRGSFIRCTYTNRNGIIHVAMRDPENDGCQALFQLSLDKHHVDFLPRPAALVPPAW
ncbi:CNH domain-containing protein [Dichotomocladium elegans]|nr:CNH domain-containing protein [Dichotomocladium elegans]